MFLIARESGLSQADANFSLNDDVIIGAGAPFEVIDEGCRIQHPTERRLGRFAMSLQRYGPERWHPEERTGSAEQTLAWLPQTYLLSLVTPTGGFLQHRPAIVASRPILAVVKRRNRSRHSGFSADVQQSLLVLRARPVTEA